MLTKVKKAWIKKTNKCKISIMWSVMVAQTLCELSSDVGGTRLF